LTASLAVPVLGIVASRPACVPSADRITCAGQNNV
jgi:hypothetical protein